MAKKKKITKTEKKLRGKRNYLKQKANGIKKQIQKFDFYQKDFRKKYEFEGKKRQVGTIVNILQNRIYKLKNSENELTFKLKKNFGFKPKEFKRNDKLKDIKGAFKKGFIRLPLARVWESKKAYDYVIEQKFKGQTSLNSFNGYDIKKDTDIVIQLLNRYFTEMDSKDILYLIIELENLNAEGEIVNSAPEKQTVINKIDNKQ